MYDILWYIKNDVTSGNITGFKFLNSRRLSVKKRTPAGKKGITADKRRERGISFPVI